METRGDWCILRTAGARTLPLARSLAEAGFEVWTPAQSIKLRMPRSKAKVEREAPILPTFVFARAEHIDELVSILAMPISPHPPFSIFRYHGRYPIVSDREIAAVRAVEERAQLARQRDERHTFAAGTAVRVERSGFEGMSGIVEDGDGKFALVAFGGGFRVKVATFLLRTNEVQEAA